MGYFIRNANANDYEMINNLAYELYNYHFKNRPDIFNNSNTCFGKEAFLKELNTKNSEILVIIDSQVDIVIGYSCFQIINKHKTLLKCARNYLFVDDIVISNNYRNQGLATLLHQKIVDYALNNNCTKIELDVFEFNKPALAFYKKLGYQDKNHCLELPL